MRRDREATGEWLERYADARADVRVVEFERLFDDGASSRVRIDRVNELLAFLHLPRPSEAVVERTWLPLLQDGDSKWSSDDVYLRIPGIEDVERELGSDANGWLFGRG
jgi:hypothetical protein